MVMTQFDVQVDVDTYEVGVKGQQKEKERENGKPLKGCSKDGESLTLERNYFRL